MEERCRRCRTPPWYRGRVVRTIIAFPGQAGRCWPLPRWRSSPQSLAPVQRCRHDHVGRRRRSRPPSAVRPVPRHGSGRRRRRTARAPRRHDVARAAASRRPTELREAVGGREHELIGIGLIAAGVLLGLAVYLNLAGPLGRGVETLFGWIVGLGRYVVPLVLVAAGVALDPARASRPARCRLVIGWALVGSRVVGIFHVVNGPDDVGELDELGRSGGVRRRARRRAAAGAARAGRRDRRPARSPASAARC